MTRPKLGGVQGLARVVSRNEISNRVKKLGLLSPEDQQLVREFIDSLGTLGPRRIEKYEAYVGKIGYELGRPFREVTRPELIRYLNGIDSSAFSEDTKRDIRLIAKKYFRWLRNDEFVKGIRTGNVEGVVGPEDILTDLELDNLRNAAKGNIRNEALVETMYELGARPGELLSLRKSDVLFDDYGAKVTLERRGLGTGKTNPRTIRVINAAPLLANWIEHHPIKDKDAPLWIDLAHGWKVHHALKWSGLLRVLQSLGRKAGIEKRFHAYIFRHTRATKLAATLTEAQLCAVFGWKVGSQMPRRYIHFSMRDVDDAILTAHGLKKKEIREAPAPKKCPRCSLVNPASAELCSKCGMALTLTEAMKKDEEIQELKEGLKYALDALRKIEDTRRQELGTVSDTSHSPLK
jgi:integrase/recombinase XerD